MDGLSDFALAETGGSPHLFANLLKKADRATHALDSAGLTHDSALPSNL